MSLVVKCDPRLYSPSDPRRDSAARPIRGCDEGAVPKWAIDYKMTPKWQRMPLVITVDSGNLS